MDLSFHIDEKDRHMLCVGCHFSVEDQLVSLAHCSEVIFMTSTDQLNVTFCLLLAVENEVNATMSELESSSKNSPRL